VAHGRGAAAFTTPTINGYKRYRQYTLAPDRVIWGRDNRGVMLRVIGGAGDGATRIENRVGEPSANPYLYMASQIVCGLDGIARTLEPGPSADAPYETDAPLLPRSLEEALVALRDDACLAAGLGAGFVDYFLRIKQGELARCRPRSRTGSSVNISGVLGRERTLPLIPAERCESKSPLKSWVPRVARRTSSSAHRVRNGTASSWNRSAASRHQVLAAVGDVQVDVQVTLLEDFDVRRRGRDPRARRS
jgi:hypothetical protein